MPAYLIVKHVKALTGLRFIAAILILFYHLRRLTVDVNGTIIRFGPFDSITANGGFGVDIFFVLSGFIMGYVYHKTFESHVTASDFCRFIWYRVARIYPLHVITMLLMLFIYLVGKKYFSFMPTTGDGPYSVASIGASFFMVHEWLDSGGVIAKLPIISNLVSNWGPFGTPNGVAWSISCEFLVYLLFPVANYILINQRKIVNVVCFISLACIYFLLNNYWGVFDNIIRVFFEFNLGLISFLISTAFRAKQFNLQSKTWLQNILGILVGGGLLILFGHGKSVFGWNYVLSVLVVSILLVVLLNERDLLSRMLGHRVLVYLGEISYSIYMTHYIVIILVSRGLLGLFPSLSDKPWLLVMLVLFGTLISSILSYHYIEQPSRKWMRQALLGYKLSGVSSHVKKYFWEKL